METHAPVKTVGLLIFLGAFSRLLPHPPNFTPVAATALLGGAYLEGAWAYLAPLGMLALSDLFLGFHATVPFVYAGFLLTAWLGRGLREAGGAKIAGAAIASSIAFFFLTNFGVWAAGGLYPRTSDGLWACYLAAIPFFRVSALGDLLFTGALFSVARLAARTSPTNNAVPA